MVTDPETKINRNGDLRRDRRAHRHATLVRNISDDERDKWCSCPFDTAIPEFADKVASERAWLARWHPTTRNVFALVAEDGRFLGKYDVPFTSKDGWRLWAPSARADLTTAAMEVLCQHIVAESRCRGVARIEVLLEGSHPRFSEARAGLLAVGFGLAEEKVVSERDLSAPLPEYPPLSLRFVPAVTLHTHDFVHLCAEVGMPKVKASEIALDSADASRWIVAALGAESVGVVLLEVVDAEAGLATSRHIGVRAHLRGRGYGRALFVHALHAARGAGAKRYVGSTASANAPMRALFRSAGFVDIGMRLVFELHSPIGCGTGEPKGL